MLFLIQTVNILLILKSIAGIQILVVFSWDSFFLSVFLLVCCFFQFLLSERCLCIRYVPTVLLIKCFNFLYNYFKCILSCYYCIMY